MLIKITIFYWILALINLFCCKRINQTWLDNLDPFMKLAWAIKNTNVNPKWLDIWITITGLSIVIGFVLIVIAVFCFLFL